MNFTVKGGNALPADTTAIWTGSLTVPEAGIYWICLQALGANAKLYVDGRRVAITGAYQGDVHGDILQANQDNVVPTTDGLETCAVRCRCPLAHTPSRSRSVRTRPMRRLRSD